ncbi:protein NRT1/ PTR FAMILY 5.5 [Sesamum alatum]|uniref:Protein NRT1/ PTR FAMILY 5.5 n=1 Tax=Sesamum alatum TaxID=300844 RepID=A0AAE2CT09_9LAMI|nr:protein NRT1/ PTR FAMILY 5.5 [Sesamum alatum]
MHVNISSVLFVDLVVGYIMHTLVTFLSNVWKLSLIHATSIVNIWEGDTKALPLTLIFIARSFTVVAPVFVLCNIAYAIGLGLLALSTPPVLGHSSATCTHSRPECIGTTQRILFYTALPLVAMGMSGIIFMFELATEDDDDDEDEEERLTLEKLYSSHLFLIPLCVVGIAFSYLKPWSLRFGIPAICCTVTFGFRLMFILCGDEPLSSEDEVKGSPLTKLIRVLVASASKVCHKLDGAEFYEKTDGLSLPRTRWLRCLDKAAIILPNKSREEQEKNSLTLCTVTEVEENQTAILIAPLCLSFIICGVVISVGNSYFLEQANHLNPKLGKLKVPFPLLLVLYDVVKSLFSRIKWSSFRVGTPNDRIPMSLFWMVPQYVLLVVVDSFLEQNVKLLFQHMIPTSSLLYLVCSLEWRPGSESWAGFSVFVVGKLSERGGKFNWFQFTLYRSHLDNYYWTLAALSAASLVFYILLSSCYKERQMEEEASPETS